MSTTTANVLDEVSELRALITKKIQHLYLASTPVVKVYANSVLMMPPLLFVA